jgi:hypothetical protein
LVSDFKEEHRQTVLGNRVLRRILIFGLMRDEIIGGWRKLLNQELRNLCSLSNTSRLFKSRRVRLAGYIADMGQKMNTYSVLVGKPEGKRPLGRPRH